MRRDARAGSRMRPGQRALDAGGGGVARRRRGGAPDLGGGVGIQPEMERR